MKKIKLFIASFVGAIALVFACVFSSVNVNATTNSSYVFDTSEIEVNTTAFGSVTNDGVQLGASIFYAVDTASSPKFSYQKAATLKNRTYSSGLYLADSSKASRNIRIVAPSSGRLKVMAYNSSTGRTISLKSSDYKDLTPAQSYDTVKKASDNDYVYFDISNEGIYRLASSGSIGFYYLEFIPSSSYSSISTPVLEQQENASGSAIRYIATVEGVTSDAAIASWTVTMSINIEGKSDYVVTFNDLYTAVGGTNGKAAVDDTVYLVATWKNISSSLNGKTVSTYFKVTLSDSSSTVLTSNTVEFTINVK